MVGVMTQPTMLVANMMEGTAAIQLLILQFVLYVSAVTPPLLLQPLQQPQQQQHFNHVSVDHIVKAKK